MHYLWRAKRYIRGNVYFGIIVFSLSIVYKIMSHISFNLFWSRGKRLLSEILKKWTFPQNTLAKNWNLKKLRHRFVYKITMITTALTSSCHWKTFVRFCLRKKIAKNSFLTLTVDYPKIVQKSKLCHSKQC